MICFAVHDGKVRHYPESASSQILSAIHTMIHPAPTKPKIHSLNSTLYLACAGEVAGGKHSVSSCLFQMRFRD